MPDVTDKELIDFCKKNATLVLSGIGFVAAEIAGRCSFETLFTLIGRYGGCELYVPVTERSPLVRLVGPFDAAKLRELWGGRRVLVPKRDKIVQLYHRAAIAQRLRAGAKVTEIAREYGVSIRTVYRHKARLAEAEARA